jgi:hypothetical protein
MWQWQLPMQHSNTAPPEIPDRFLVQRREGCTRYKKHNKERTLYINNEQVRVQVLWYMYAADEVEFEDILSDHGQNEKEIFRFHGPLF